MIPAARVVIGGKDVSAALLGADGPLVRLSVTDEAGMKSDSLELDLDNRENFKVPKDGTEIQVWLGYEPAPVYMGRYTVGEWSKTFPVKTITVSAKAAEMTGKIKAAKSRSFDQKTVGAIVQQVAGEHGLSSTISPEVASIQVEHIDQQNESDLSFLTRLARRNGATFKVADGKAVVTKRGSSSLPSGGSKPAIVITPPMITEATVTGQKRGEYKSVKCSWQDHGQGKRRTVTAGSGEPVHRDRRVYASETEARQAAEAQLGDYTRGKVSLEINAPGMPAIFAEGLADVQLGDPDMDGEYLIKTVRHEFSSSGFTTSLSLESKGGGATGSGSDE